MQLFKSVNKLTQKMSIGSLTNTSILHNKWILYFVFLVLIVNLYSHLVIGNYRFLATIFLIGFLVSQFTKNMMVIMLISLTLSNALRNVWTGKEGFEDKMEDSEEEVNEESVETTEDESNEGMTTEEKDETTDPEINKLIKDKDKLVALKKDAEELLTTQKEILNGLNKMEPLLNRAEKLSEKFSTRR